MTDEPTKEQVLRRLARIEGQVRGIARMVSARRYCVDVVTQVAAVESALHRVSELILRKHLETCVAAAFRNGDPAERTEKVEELMGIYSKFRAR